MPKKTPDQVAHAEAEGLLASLLIRNGVESESAHRQAQEYLQELARAGWRHVRPRWTRSHRRVRRPTRRTRRGQRTGPGAAGETAGCVVKRSELRRTTPMRRSGPPNRKNPPKKKRVRKPDPERDFWAEQRMTIYLRAWGLCERCGARLDETGMEAHHRKLRSQGGGHGVENLLALCPDCHHNHVHARPVEARMNGWIVPSGGDPAARAVLLWDGRTVRLTDEGNYDVVFDDSEEATG